MSPACGTKRCLGSRTCHTSATSTPVRDPMRTPASSRSTNTTLSSSTKCAPPDAGVKVVRPRLRLRALHLDPTVFAGAPRHQDDQPEQVPPQAPKLTARPTSRLTTQAPSEMPIGTSLELRDPLGTRTQNCKRRPTDPCLTDANRWAPRCSQRWRTRRADGWCDVVASVVGFVRAGEVHRCRSSSCG
jgi:hypothetical protein